MGVPSDAAVPAGDFVKRLDETNSNVAQTRTARRGEATSVGARGMRFHSGGSATFEGGGGIIVRDGGDVVVEDGGSLSAEYPSGRAATKFGPLTLESTGAPDGHGLLVQADDDSNGRDIFRAKYVNSQRIVWIGQTPGSDASGAVDEFTADAAALGLHAHGDELRLQTHAGADLLMYVNGNANMLVDNEWDANVTGNLDFDMQGTALIQSNTSMQLLCEGTAALGGTTGTFLQPASGGVSANVHMDTATGRIRYVVSSERYKTDIQDLPVDTAAVLQMRPRTWQPLPPTQQCPEWLHALHGEDECRSGEAGTPVAGPRHVGFIAEELDAIGLGAFVSRDTEGLPDGIHYDRLTAAVIPVLQAQQQQIAALTARLDALESTTADGP
jgi:hypothetical protein